MKNYFDKLLDYLESGEIEEAVSAFEQWKMAGLLSTEEIEKLNEVLPGWSEMVSQAAHARLLAEKGEFTPEEFLERVKTVDREMSGKLRWKKKKEFWIKA